MKRTNEEFKAEVFRRRDEYYKKRGKRISTITALCVPFVVCVALFTVMILPAMMPAGSADMSGHGNEENYPCYSGSPEIATEPTGAKPGMNEESFLKTANKIYVTADETVTQLGENAKEEMISFLISLVSEECEITGLTPESKPLYEIEIHFDIGAVRTYEVYENFVSNGEKCYSVTANDVSNIKSILGIRG